MNRLLSTVTLCVLLAASLFAAGRSVQGNPQSGGSEIPPLIASLNLKEGQKKKLEPVYAERNKQLKAISEDKTLTDDARRARINQLNQTINESLRQVLTQNQKKRLSELRKGKA
jgi:Spy/CpxP family protein refolding chaperone